MTYPFAAQAFDQIASQNFINGVATAVDLLRAPAVAFVPVITGATTNPTNFTADASASYYVVQGYVCYMHAQLTARSGFTAGAGAYGISLPVAAAAVIDQTPFVVRALDTSAVANYPGQGRIFAGSSKVDRCYFTLGSTATLSPTYPFTWALDDTLTIDGSYLIA